MKKIHIIGENSYIGNSFHSFAEHEFEIIKVNSRENAWQKADFSDGGCVLFCAGIAHRKAPDSLHYAVNCDLPLKIAEKAKNDGASRFIYISSAAVLENSFNPKTAYGKSKLKAETELKKTETSGFDVTIIRPPMVYGKNCKGNFTRLVKLSNLLPLFPSFPNRRSMIYIGNLCYFLSFIIREWRNNEGGIYFPQDAEPHSTAELYRLIRINLGKKYKLTGIFNPLIRPLRNLPFLNKLFGDFVHNGSNFEKIDYIGFEEAIKRSV